MLRDIKREPAQRIFISPGKRLSIPARRTLQILPRDFGPVQVSHKPIFYLEAEKEAVGPGNLLKIELIPRKGTRSLPKKIFLDINSNQFPVILATIISNSTLSLPPRQVIKFRLDPLLPQRSIRGM